ncbi:hypothetical protein [Mycobacterium haemophilum]|uniref:Uncharacterized protein n=1 Tax=Mycobacterium haemophilum TaxID=29311 RepID=A0A0I9UH65_9MYCO|nr:hypothetical protein [Mycobacterium haemophilum]KLO27042.1 hypothetical protein ABH39_16765 [Mycobacterium haemophilum]KLO34973.1 hypothetical protein ABH38_17490 [Mycobacterium haemophilum]KLO40950.1 hypothetical protein ABH37_15065 [Mycobacterium haemophilum]KLO47274.1 hypothetical protein ABH36_17420 [Mycobacterium haemophilum]
MLWIVPYTSLARWQIKKTAKKPPSVALPGLMTQWDPIIPGPIIVFIIDGIPSHTIPPTI